MAAIFLFLWIGGPVAPQEGGDNSRIAFSDATRFASFRPEKITPPSGWFWSHDIQTSQIETTATPGYRIQRLSVYGAGRHRRFAGFFEPGMPARRYAVDLTSDMIKKQNPGLNPVSLCVDASLPEPGFSAVLEPDPTNESVIQVDLNEKQLHALVSEQRRITDLVVYSKAGARRYAVIVRTMKAIAGKQEPWFLFTNLSQAELAMQLQRSKARLLRLRRHTEKGEVRFHGIAVPAGKTKSTWYASIDADSLAEALERENSYLIDLDAFNNGAGLRFTAVMIRSD
ncbi:MAG: hypothetical protein JNM27_04360 [Leptospirales bacterium]|nr:hypothetical protein [Leptospirales bacterium]